MPDLLTHLFLGLSLALILRLEAWEDRYLIVVGSVAIDIERPFTLLVDKFDLQILGLAIPFHSLFGSLFLSLLISSFFDLKDRKFRKCRIGF